MFKNFYKKCLLRVPGIKSMHDELCALRVQVGKYKEEAAAAEKEEQRHAGFREHEMKKLAALENKKLNFGCGAYPLRGWTNIDGGDGKNYAPSPFEEVVRLDVFDALRQLPDGSVQFITSEQFFEHFTRQEGMEMLRECWRVLEEDGVIRIQVPDLEMIMRLYHDDVPFAPWKTVQLPHRLRHVAGRKDCGQLLPGEEYLPSFMVNNSFYMDGHKFIYDFETLGQSLELAGFSSVGRCRYGESGHGALRNIDRHDGGETGKSWIPQIALIVEAVKRA